MTEPIKHKYHSTGQFRNVIKSVRERTTFVGLGENGKPIHDPTREYPVITFIGTTKLHGTNGSIVLDEDGTISFHSKNNLLGYLRDDEFTLLSDNAEFAQTMYRRIDTVKEVLEKALIVVKENNGTVTYPIKISGEWCGQGIQKGVGISYLPKKSFFIFGIKAGETNQDTKQGWLPVTTTSDLVDSDCNIAGIYSITDFPCKSVDIDFANPEYSQNILVQATEEVESCCPVSNQLELKDAEGAPTLLGEGLVWTPVEYDLCWDSGMWFKTKGEKHSVSKVKTVAAICPEKLSSIQEFVEYAVTENRLQQGLSEVGSDVKLTGAFIGWINKDINKEEGDVLEANNLTMKDVGKYLSTKARTWYMKQL